jgi:6-pyruvoyltetrahydropterin/6-carboxytetrahydropterin synthase
MERVMYRLGLKETFVARHYLIGGDFGAENKLHSHVYQVEIILMSQALNEHGYITDITDVKDVLSRVVASYRDQVLNDLTPFDNLNPSLENFCRIFLDQYLLQSTPAGINSVEVKIWEDDCAWTSATRSL